MRKFNTANLVWVVLVLGWALLLFSLLGCSDGAPVVPPKVDAAEPENVVGTISGDAFRPFEVTGPTVNVQDFETAANAFGDGNRTVIVPAGTYIIGKLDIPNNTIVRMEPGVTIKDSGKLSPVERLINIRGENVHIIGHGARVIANRADYTTGEQRHGVFIADAHNVRIEGLESSGHGGDGFYIGGVAGFPSTDISLIGVAADNNRRQGLSIVSGARVYVSDGEFSNTKGTRPEFGIDLEPNSALDVLQDITILRPRTLSNNGGGITVGLSGFEVGGSGRAATIYIIGHYSEGERIVYQQASIRSIDRVVRKP